MNTSGARIVIIAAEFNREVVDPMVVTAEDELRKAGGQLLRVIRVSGCYEVPLIADLQLGKADTDGLVVLGHIERGETLHGEVMGHVVHGALVAMQLKHRKPVGIGIIGPGATLEQAQQRKTGSAKAAVKAVLQNYELLSQ